LKGCETPMLVLFTNFVTGEIIQNLVSRCQTKLAIVCEEKQISDIFEGVSTEYTNSICQVIPVYGKLKLRV